MGGSTIGMRERRDSAAAYNERFMAAFVAWRWPEPGTQPELAIFVAEALRKWLAGRPEDAEDVQRLAVSAAMACVTAGDVEAAARLVDAGLDASMLGAITSDDRRFSTSYLALFGARLAFERDDVAEARILADRARDSMDEQPGGGPLAAYLRLHRSLIEARLAEAALEIARAREAYRAATDLAASLSKGSRAIALLPAWSDVVFGPVAQPESAAPMLRAELEEAARLGLLGLARTSSSGQAARDAIARCLSEGLPVAESVLALSGILDRLSPAEVDAAVDRLVHAARSLAGPRRAAWELAIGALALDARIRSDGPATLDLADASAILERQAVRERADPLSSMLALAARARERYAADDTRAAWQAIDRLLGVRSESAGALAGSRLELRARAAAEPALVAALTAEATRFTQGAAIEQRRRLAALIDALRWPEDARPITSWSRAARDALARAEGLATDRLGRLAHAVMHGPHAGEVLALVPQDAGSGMSFLIVGGDDVEPIVSIPPSPGALRALVALSSAAEQRIAGSIAEVRLVAEGRAAFDALPDTVRDRLARVSTIVIVLDLAAGRDRIPFELLHDGTTFLGLRAVITRCLSLSHALRVLEPALVPPATGRRALCVAVASPPGLPGLPHAAHEPALVRDALGSGWDTQLLLDFDAEPEAVLDLAPLANILHVACHGDSAQGAEALVLAGGRRLRAVDIASRHRLGGVAYLNACSLGRGRYVGGGLSRGAAYAFARAGSPTVIANLLPVVDDKAQEFAVSFYAEVRDHPVGEALRRARAALSDRVSAALWSTTVLLGDPFRRLDGTRDDVPDATGRLFAGQATPPKRRLKESVAAADRDPGDVRLAAAVELSRAVNGRVPPDAAARVAREIGHDIGEAQYLLDAAQAMRSVSNIAAQQDALRTAMAALEPLRGRWEPARDAYVESETELRQLDPTYKPRQLSTFRFDSGMTVNDRSDPAVDFFLRLSEAQFEHERFWRGEPALAIPDPDSTSIAHNALVWGWTHRLYGTGAESAYARSCAERLAWRGIIAAAAVPYVQRVWAGLLCFLWGRHKVTHLEGWLLRAHTRVLEIGLDRARRGWTSGAGAASAPFAGEISSALDHLDRPVGDELASTMSRFARARAAMATGGAGRPVDAVADRVASALGACRASEPDAAADLAAWTIGDVLERQRQALEDREPRQTAALAFRSLFDRLEDHVEGWILPYLAEGFAGERESGGMDLFARWSRQLL